MREVKPTQKPVPSSDIKDLFFNSGLLDIWTTSLERKYIDRFGNCHLTAAGMEWLFKELVEKFKVDMNTAIVAAGYITIDSFQQGADLPNNELTQRNYILRDETSGEYYRWDGDLPKQVPAGSTPQSTGGIGKGAWVSVGDASLRSDLNRNSGASMIGTDSGKTVQDELTELSKYEKVITFNVQSEAAIYTGNAKHIRVMGFKEFGDNGSGIFIIDPRQDYDTPNNPDRFKNTTTGKYWFRILNDSMNPYVGLENSAIIKASEKKNLSPWNALAPVNILGDSITYGYFSSWDGSSGNGKSYGGGLFYHTWTSLFARMFAADSGTNCYKGFIPLPLGYADDWDVFKQVTKSGVWSVVNDGDYAANLYSGSAYQTTDANAELVYAIPATFDEIQIFYCNQPNGGELTISVNGEVWQTLNTASTKVENKALKRRTVSNPQGSMIISIKKTDGAGKPVGVCGVGVDNVVTFTSSNTRGGAINQFATPGRTLASVSEDVIKDCTKNASALILALGFNDKNISYSGAANIPKRIEFSKRIDW
ncbi:tail fiber/spike domain-containing protein, partial [Providencia huashanensis]|uniref:tail fiber/spike domain-containing protein n=1 Tax=Providencia huashanensis TaxID=3037798 RepID=UPI0040460EA0